MDDDNVLSSDRFQDQLDREARAVGIAEARAQAVERKAYALERIAVARELSATYATEFLDSKELGRLYKSASAKIAIDVLTGEIAVRNGTEAANLIEKLSTAGRLEEGETTSMTLTLAGDEQLERIKALRDEANQRVQEAEKAKQATVIPMKQA